MNDTHYGKMSEAELSKKLGQYQKQARIWTIIGLIGVLGGVISFFAVDDIVLKSVLMRFCSSAVCVPHCFSAAVLRKS